ncbi:MAG: hypothetical protein RI924_147 [Bacteroidota bacterium]|jgi:four helix bundle protein
MDNYKKYTELEVWAKARQLVTSIYELTKELPKEEQFGLISQLQRCAISIPSNIAEGCGRRSPKDSLHFFFVARGSIYELETQLFLSYDLGYLNKATLDREITQIETVRKLLNGFIRYYRQH